MLYEKVKRDKVGNDVFAKHWGGRGGGEATTLLSVTILVSFCIFFLKIIYN